MNPKPNLGESVPVDPDDGHPGEIDAFIERNRDALNASIERARSEPPSNRTVDEIIAAGLARHRKS